MLLKKKLLIPIIVFIVVGVAGSLVYILVTDNADEEKLSKKIIFPDNFEFGAASASYQIEGGWNLDGKGPSIWDKFLHENPNSVKDRTNGDIAINSYEFYKEDVKALKAMKVNFYRFSISWSRILPNGKIDTINQKGIDYYHKLIDELLKENIKPMVTMFHWDMPQGIQDEGGLNNASFIDYFEAYANLLFKEYGEKVKTWITFNEPHLFCVNGYGEGVYPPNINLSGIGDYLCIHYTILSHARVYHLYKNEYFKKQGGRLSMAIQAKYFYPEDDNDYLHKRAQEKAIQFTLGIFAHPILSEAGDYPEIVRNAVDRSSIIIAKLDNSRLPIFGIEMLKYVKGTLDFLGINYYTSSIVKPAVKDTFKNPSIDHDIYCDIYSKPEWPKANSDWLYSVPDGLYKILMWIKNEYNNIEVVITENGWSDKGELIDNDRIVYMKNHFDAIHRAIKYGCNVTGHTSWSVIDNFEWTRGYTEKFGLYRVNQNDSELKRIPKASSHFLRQLIETKQLIL